MAKPRAPRIASTRWVRQGEPVPLRRDYPRIKRLITENSLSDSYDEARTEWTLATVYVEGDEQFTDHCDLCNAAGLKTDFEIRNEGTGKSFLVGSTCIQRFIQFKGTSSQEESNALLNARARKHFLSRKLADLLPAILGTPTVEQVRIFHDLSRAILGPLSPRAVAANGAAWADYLELLFGTIHAPENQIARVRQAIYEPGKVPMKKPDMRQTPESVGKWADITRVKDTRIKTTLRRSQDERPDRRKID